MSYLLCFQITLRFINKILRNTPRAACVCNIYTSVPSLSACSKFTIVTDRSALQWLHSFKDPDGTTPRWLEKLEPFDYEVRHRPGNSIGYADGLSRIPPDSINAIDTDLPSTSTQNEFPKPATAINSC